MRHVLILLMGLAIGAAAAILIRDSILPPGGTPEAEILSLKDELRATRQQLAKIDPAQARPRDESVGRALNAGVQNMLDDFKNGRPVNLNNAYQSVKPLMGALVPVFDKIRRHGERRHFERIAGEMSRKYNLTGPQQEELKQWMKDRSERNFAAFKAVATAPGTRLDDLVRATKDVRPDDGLDAFMESKLQGAALESFRKDRLTERAERVQNEADWKVERLNNMVGLDEEQKDKVFSIMARSSRDFDPQMQLEGVTADSAPAPGSDRDADIMTILRPDQQASYNDWRDKRRIRAEEEFRELGMAMPEGWDALSAD